jgi:hypothetical protein
MYMEYFLYELKTASIVTMLNTGMFFSFEKYACISKTGGENTTFHF